MVQVSVDQAVTVFRHKNAGIIIRTGKFNMKNKKILVVDDNVEHADMLSNLLTKLGHYTRKAYDGFDGFILLNKEEFDFAFVDLNMPGKDGIDFYDDLMNVQPDCVMVLMTGYPEHIIKKKPHQKGIDYIILKPFSLDEIRDILSGIKN